MAFTQYVPAFLALGFALSTASPYFAEGKEALMNFTNAVSFQDGYRTNLRSSCRIGSSSHFRQKRQLACSWGSPAVSRCFPASSSSAARCGLARYTCDPTTNYCCARSTVGVGNGIVTNSNGNNAGFVRPQPPCPDNSPAISTCLFGYCGPFNNLVCTTTRLCCVNNAVNAGQGMTFPVSEPLGSCVWSCFRCEYCGPTSSATGAAA